MKRILVTGGTGYIGSHTVVELMNSGYEVVIVDNLSNSNVSSIYGIERIVGRRPLFEELDCCNQHQMVELFNKYQFDGVVHFAAFKSISESTQIPLLYYRNNIQSLMNILIMMSKVDVRHLVFSSSCSVYGEQDVLPVTELSPLNRPTSPYGNTKKICEEIICDTVTANTNLSCISLRYFNPIGAHPSGFIGESPIGKPDNLIPFITQTAIGDREKLKVFGGDYDTPDGTPIRDYFHVVDLAKAHVLALNRLFGKLNEGNFEAFNVGSGKGVTVLQLIKSFEKVTGIKLNYEIVGRRNGDVDRVWADISWAQIKLGWYPSSTLDECLLTAWNWQKSWKNMNQ